MIHDARVRSLNETDVQNRPCVLYWMQASQRVDYNHALEYAARLANDLGKPLVVFFGITNNYPEANRRHYRFMIEGLRETQQALAERDIVMVVRKQSPEIGVVETSKQVAAAVVTDCGYTRVQRDWRAYAAQRLDCPLIEVESDVVVPVATASGKEAYAAADFRRHIGKRLQDFLVPLHATPIKARSKSLDWDSADLADVDRLLGELAVDDTADTVAAYAGGTSQAVRLLEGFIASKLHKYAELRNDPSEDYQSGMSPYLHFGQISPLFIALTVRQAGGPEADAYLEELIVRRELAINYLHYNSMYATYEALPQWARASLEEHRQDKREESYSLEQLERGETYDLYWNAAQLEMLRTGKMHGYMRMYWGKRIIEWMASPKEAFQIALCLNNKYELDGRDPNSYAGVAWCFGKHDRPWPEQPVFGKVRKMTQSGLKKKFDADAYVRRVDQMSSASQ